MDKFDFSNIREIPVSQDPSRSGAVIRGYMSILWFMDKGLNPYTITSEQTMDETMESEAKSLALGKSIRPTTQIQTGAYAKSSSASWDPEYLWCKMLSDRQWRYKLSCENITQVIHLMSVLRKEKRLCRGWLWALCLSRRKTSCHDVTQRQKKPQFDSRDLW